MNSIGFWLAALLVLLVAAVSTVRMAWEYQRAVIFRFGRLKGLRGPGLFLLIPLAEKSVRVDLRTVTLELDTQETVTKDGVAVKVNAVLWYRAVDPALTVVAVANWNNAVKQAAETALRDTIGQNELDILLKDRATANESLKVLLSRAIGKWGVEAMAVELKDLDIPESMQRAIAREAEAVREKRARIIKAEGELAAAQTLAQAAATMESSPAALQLRQLQTLSEIGAEHNSTIVVAMPTDSQAGTMAALMRAFTTRGTDREAKGDGG
jgi:regulator of protease activity HflC (stomatin/prohibitin superfamily)